MADLLGKFTLSEAHRVCSKCMCTSFAKYDPAKKQFSRRKGVSFRVTSNEKIPCVTRKYRVYSVFRIDHATQLTNNKKSVPLRVTAENPPQGHGLGHREEGSWGRLGYCQDGRHCCVMCVLSQEDVRVARQGHAAVCHQRRVLVLGGVSEGTEFMNDCLV